MVASAMAYKVAYNPARTINGKRPADDSGGDGMGEGYDPGGGEGGGDEGDGGYGGGGGGGGYPQ